ncbi:MAG: AAA family ATPase [Phycisphaeraceae bacterium]
MNEQSNDHQPTLVIVTGRPGSGKTTLAHALAREVRCPALCRDELKEGLVNTAGDHDQLGKDANWHIYETFFATIELLMDRGITLVAEAAFQHKLWAPKLEPHVGRWRMRLIVCTIDGKLARTRFIERGVADPLRERFHGDRAVRAHREGVELPIGEYDPPQLPVPTLSVDTTVEYSPPLSDILKFVRASDRAAAEPAGP